MRTTKYILMFCAAMIAFSSCKKDKNDDVQAEAKVMLDVVYGGLPQQKMDVYLPANRTTATPVLIVLHGGGFVAGDKQEFTTQAQQLSDKGYAVLNINYQLVDTEGLLQLPPLRKQSAVTITSQLADIQAAVDFAAGKAGEWVMASSGWGISGHSAGGTLAMLYAYGEGNAGKRVVVAANWAGATDLSFRDEAEFNLLDPRVTELYQRATGALAKNESKLAFMAVSPYWVASKGGAIPTLNIRPESNVVLNLPDASKAQYQAFTDVLTSKNIANKFVEVAGADHGFSKPGNWDLVLNETAAFFEQYRE